VRNIKIKFISLLELSNEKLKVNAISFIQLATGNDVGLMYNSMIYLEFYLFMQMYLVYN